MSGTPIIVSQDSGCGKLVMKIGCGLTAPSRDIKKIEDSICYVLDNPSECEEMLKKGQKYINENMSWEIVVKRFIETYKNIIKPTQI